jgi:DNA-binding GntR family transcriptional regulator
MDNDICRERTITLHQHHKILDAVIKQDAKLAGEAMADHLSEMMSIRESLKATEGS